jgi:hypothetical protein
MIPTLHHSRSRSRSLARASMSLVLMALLSFAATQARAVVTFEYYGAHSVTWHSNSWNYFSIYRVGGRTPLTVHTYLTGSSNFGLNGSQLILDDSTKDTVANTIGVVFGSNKADTSIAWLYFNDGVHIDSIELIGYGTSATADFRMCDSVISITVVHDSSGNVKAEAQSCLTNTGNSPITATLHIMDSSNFSFGNSGGTLIASLSALATQNFTVYYKGKGRYKASTQIAVSCNSPFHQYTYVIVNVVDPSLAPPSYKPTIIAPNVGLVLAGDSACGLVTIANTNLNAITITRISNTDSINWSMNANLKFPFTLQPGGTAMFTLCYHSNGNDYGAYVSDKILVWYQDSNTNPYVSVTATAHVQLAVDAHDSTALDDVVVGGFVEASAYFVTRKAGTVTTGTAGVDYGGTVEILSPAMPKTVKAGDTVVLRYRVTPRSDSVGVYYGYIDVNIGTWSGTAIFWGKTVGATSSDSAHGLSIYADQNELVAMRTSNHVQVDTFWFANNYGGNVTVSNAKLSSGAHFQILGYLPGSLPITLSANQSMGIIMQFNGDTVGFYRDSLYLDASHNIWSQPINVQAYATQSAGVRDNTVSTTASLFVSPNPANGPVAIAIAGARTANVEVYDLLGGRIVSIPNTMDASWNADGLSGGAYIVRASGTDSNGNPYSITKRLILVR